MRTGILNHVIRLIEKHQGVMDRPANLWGRGTLVLICCAILGAAFPGCSSSSGGKGPGGDAASFSDEDLALYENRYGQGNIPQAQEGGLFKDILFAYDSAVVEPRYHDVLAGNAKVLSNDTTLHAEIEGHCDKRGTNEYNLALGEERAKAVAALMVSFGARPGQISVISYGEEIPIDPGDHDQAYAKNRRAHFALYRKPEAR